MKKNIIEIKKLIKLGLCVGLTVSLASCANEGAGVLDDNTDTTVNTSETGTFEGSVADEENTAILENDMTEDEPSIAMDVAAEVNENNMLFEDFTATNYYEEWDMNNDQLLNENEYNEAFFDTWDLDDNNTLDENEWNMALGDFGFDNDAAWNRSEWDTDNDGQINMEEFSMNMGDIDLFETWDDSGDDMLDEIEFTNGISSLWTDADDDGILDEDEYKDMYVRYFDIDAVRYMPERG